MDPLYSPLAMPLVSCVIMNELLKHGFMPVLSPDIPKYCVVCILKDTFKKSF